MSRGIRRAGKQSGNADADMSAVQREAQAFSLRAQGWEFPDIAEQCGYANASGAYKAYKRALSRIPKRAIEEMRELILTQEMRAMKAMKRKIDAGDTFAIREMTLIHDRMAKLFGLDTPVQAEPATSARVIVRAYPPEWVSALPPAPGAAIEAPPAESVPAPEEPLV